jgi:hypothetical protein
MGDPLLQSLSEFSLYNPASAKSYRPLHLILRCLSGFPRYLLKCLHLPAL